MYSTSSLYGLRKAKADVLSQIHSLLLVRNRYIKEIICPLSFRTKKKVKSSTKKLSQHDMGDIEQYRNKHFCNYINSFPPVFACLLKLNNRQCFSTFSNEWYNAILTNHEMVLHFIIGKIQIDCTCCHLGRSCRACAVGPPDGRTRSRVCRGGRRARGPPPERRAGRRTWSARRPHGETRTLPHRKPRPRRLSALMSPAKVSYLKLIELQLRDFLCLTFSYKEKFKK